MSDDETKAGSGWVPPPAMEAVKTIRVTELLLDEAYQRISWFDLCGTADWYAIAERINDLETFLGHLRRRAAR